MGYSTDFMGSLQLSRPATQQEKEFINTVSTTRRMKRDVEKLFELYDGKFGNPFAKTREEIYGNEGEFFVGEDKPNAKNTVIDQNSPPGHPAWGTRNVYEEGKCQPGLWCQWIVTEDGEELEWDGGEKFYNYVEWLKYQIKNFFEPWGIKLNGEIEWTGEDREDLGKIVVVDNVVTVLTGSVTYS
jgi:hypothetical protein